MKKHDLQNEVLKLAIEQWNKSFGGASALDICDKIGTTNEEVMTAMESLNNQEKGNLNRNVQLYQISFDLDNPKNEYQSKPVTTHIFFPSRRVLTDFFYSSGLVRQNFPEYKNRLHQGANQLELVFFFDEVLARYLYHPELYEIDDSLAGGNIWSKECAPESRYINVRHGKSKLNSGKTAVTAIFKDLYTMSAEEQRHWHSYEIVNEKLVANDPNFSRFLARTYEGSFVDFPNPLKDISSALIKANDHFPEGSLFKRTENDHLRLPVENTLKSFYDSSSELYKLVGADSLNQKAMKSLLLNHLSVKAEELIHQDTERHFSSLQLLELIEHKLNMEPLLSKTIRKIGTYRIEADHKLTKAKIDNEVHVDKFVSLCEELTNAVLYFSLNEIKIIT